MKLRITKKSKMLLAWLDNRGKIKYMSNMTQQQKLLVKSALGNKNEKASTNAPKPQIRRSGSRGK